MAEWGIPFHVIENEWTQRQFNAMCDRLTERLESQQKAHGSRGAQGRSGKWTMKYKDAIQQGLF